MWRRRAFNRRIIPPVTQKKRSSYKGFFRGCANDVPWKKRASRGKTLTRCSHGYHGDHENHENLIISLIISILLTMSILLTAMRENPDNRDPSRGRTRSKRPWRLKARNTRETIITFNDEEETAFVWTASESVYRRLLNRLGRAYLSEDGERHAVFIFPAEFLALPRAKAKRVLTPEQRAQLARRLARSPEIVGGNEQNGHGLRGSWNITKKDSSMRKKSSGCLADRPHPLSTRLSRIRERGVHRIRDFP